MVHRRAGAVKTAGKNSLLALPIVAQCENNAVKGAITGERLCLIKYPTKMVARHTRLFTGIYGDIRVYVHARATIYKRLKKKI